MEIFSERLKRDKLSTVDILSAENVQIGLQKIQKLVFSSNIEPGEKHHNDDDNNHDNNDDGDLDDGNDDDGGIEWRPWAGVDERATGESSPRFSSHISLLCSKPTVRGDSKSRPFHQCIVMQCCNEKEQWLCWFRQCPFHVETSSAW